MVSGIWGGNVNTLSLQHNMPAMYKMEIEHGSIFRGFAKSQSRKKVDQEQDHMARAILNTGGSFSLRGGTECLPNALKSQWLGDEAVSFVDRKVSKIVHGTTGQLDLTSQDPSNPTQELKTSYDQIFSTIPAFELAPALTEFDSELSQTLKQIPYISMGLVEIAYGPENPIDFAYRGFGFLASAQEKKPYLGVTFDSYAFPQLNENAKEKRFTLMIGGDQSKPHKHNHLLYNSFFNFFFKNILRYSRKDPDPMKLTDEEILQIANNCLKDDLGITAKPSAIRIKRAENCLPQAHVGYQQDVLKKILSTTSDNIFNSKLAIGGAFVKGVSINDCMTLSKELAEDYIGKLSKQ